ncbi:MAG: 2-C-methyl-D-erythritol 4-phosphate cytidylyltransferase [Pyrinomonadaceae bacterium]
MNTAIIVAAGTGSRFAAAQPKQFASLLGKPLILHTLEQFEACSMVDAIVLVLSESGRSEFERIEAPSTWSKTRSIITGGATRAESVCNGLDAIDPSTANIVAVHDGARPLVSVDEITRTIRKADDTGAACLVAELNDTIKEVDASQIIGTVDRKKLRRALTPQAFRYEILKRAFVNAELSDAVTDECFLVEMLGVPIATVDGSSRNIKITRAEDIMLAEMFLRDDDA